MPKPKSKGLVGRRRSRIPLPPEPEPVPPRLEAKPDNPITESAVQEPWRSHMIRRFHEDGIVRIETGEYVWWPRVIKGFLDAGSLTVLTNELNRLNAPLEAEYEAYVKAHDERSSTSGS